MLTVDEAVKAVRDGQVVKMVVGQDPDDPVCLVWNDNGCAMTHSIGGWSAGVTEPICGIGSDFLGEAFFGGKTSPVLTVADEGETARARDIRYEF
jgi:hypothetical protein